MIKRTKQVTVRFSEEELNRIDQARGAIPREPWIRARLNTADCGVAPVAAVPASGDERAAAFRRMG